VTPCSLTVPKITIITLGLVTLLASACASVPPPLTAAHSTTSPAVVTSSLHCRARAISKHPRDRTTVMIRVHTAAHAQVTATATFAMLNGQRVAGRASATGERMLRFRVGNATPGARVVIDVRVSRHGRKGICRASFRPRSARSAPAPARTPPAASPSPAPSPPPTAASCYPLSNEGTCYEPGEFCRDSDHGLSGLAGDGEKIRCEDNDGWRWEPV
jgi:hypothetical protein